METGSFRLLDLCLNHLAMLYLNIFKATDSKYIWDCVSNSLGPSVIQKFHLGHSLALHTKRKRCGQLGPSPCHSLSQVVYAYQVLGMPLQGIVWPNLHFGLF